jgi:hypothetical protein
MDETQVNALVEAAGGAGVDFDGLRAVRDDSGYTFAVTSPTQRDESVERAGLSESGFREFCREHPRYVSNWHYWTHEVGGREESGRLEEAGDSEDDGDGSADANAPAGETHRYAFLRWVERAADLSVPERYDALADDLTRSWGQLRVSAALGEDGERRYGVRHEDDEGVDTDDLDTYADPLDARDIVTFDDRGRYRPLKTAPTLPTGWAFPGLSGPDLVRTVDTIYPATVANWHLEEQGELDVSHWRETMERQTGIYGVIQTWDRGEGHEHVNWVAEACCADSQCLKRREWEYDDESDLDVDGGEGVFPCREPCSLVVAAARKWTQLEGEESRTYEFDLTPSEKEQVEEIVDAVADGRTDEIREADIYKGANRYRARFLRAKRMDAEGNLSGTPTESEGEE